MDQRCRFAVITVMRERPYACLQKHILRLYCAACLAHIKRACCIGRQVEMGCLHGDVILRPTAAAKPEALVNEMLG